MRPLLCAVLLLNGLPAAMASTSDELNWLCSLSVRPDFALHCRLEADPALDDELPAPSGGTSSPSAVTRAAPVDQEQIRRALFASGSAANVARLIREQPGQYRTMTWTIPLYGPPIDEVQVRHLAQSVLCGSAVACQAHFGPAPLPLRTATR